MSVPASSVVPARFWPKAFREACALTLVAVLLAMIAAWLRPMRPTSALTPRPLVEERTIADLGRANSPIVWVDARSEREFLDGHIANAVRLNQEAWEGLLPGFLAAWQPDMIVVVYCQSGKCHTSQEVAVRIRREFQIDKVVVLKNGWAAWQEAQRP